MEEYHAIDQVSFEQASKLKAAEGYKELIDHFINTTNEDDFVNKLEEYTQQPWERCQDIMSVWVPVLNKIQDIYKQIIEEHNLDIHIPELKDITVNTKNKSNAHNTDSVAQSINYNAFLTHLPKDVEQKLIKVLDFTFFLFKNTTQRSDYPSTNELLALLNAPNIEIKLRCIKVLLLDIGESMSPWNPAKNVKAELKTKLTSMILALQCHISSENILKNSFDMVDFLSNYSPKSYGIPENAKLISPANIILPFTYKYYSEKNNHSLEVFKITNEKLISTSYEDLLELIKSQNKIPEHYWFEISIQLYVAKAFAIGEDSTNSKIQSNFLLADDKDKLQQIFDVLSPYIQLKFYTVGLINALVSPPAVSSSIFELDGSIFECLCRFVLQAYPLQKVPDNFSLKEIRVAALYALKFISDRHVWCLDILKCVGGNATHGAIFLLLDRMHNAIANKPEDVDVDYNMRLFDVISNLTSVSSINDSLVSAGLIYKLTNILKVPNNHEYQTILKVSDVLKCCIKTVDNVNVFENAGGYKLLHDRLSTELEYGLATKDQFKHIKYYSEVYFTLSFRQVCYIRSLLKHILKVIDIDTTDKIRNFIDSNMLSTLNVLLLNRNDFGFTLISYVLDVVQVLLNKDPTIYQVLQEAGTIDIIIDNFADYLGPWTNLLLTLPQLVSALCLNKAALKKIKESNIIKLLFQPYRDAKLASVLIKYMESEYGENLDELYRYHPDLQEMMTNEFADAINSLDIKYEQELVMTPPKGALFGKSTGNFEGTPTCDDYSFDATDSGMLIRFAFLSLYGCEWANLNKKLDCTSIVKKIYNEKTPATFLKSDTQVAVIDVLKSSEFFDFKEVFAVFTTTVIDLLGDLKNFKDGYMDKSYFLNCKSKKEVQKYIGLLNVLSVNFQTLINIAYDYGTFSDKKCGIFVNTYLKDDNSEEQIFTAMSNLFIKLNLEENQIARSLTPQQEANTLTQKSYVVTMKQDLNIKKTKFNDYFSNNVFMIRYWSTNINFNIVLFFKSFLRVFTMDKNDYDPDTVTNQVRAMEFTMRALYNIVDFLVINKPPTEETYSMLFMVYSAMKKEPFGFQGRPRQIDFFVSNLYYRFRMNIKLFKLLENVIERHYILRKTSNIEFYDVKGKFLFERNEAVLMPKCIQLLFDLTQWANDAVLDEQDEIFDMVILTTYDTPPNETEWFSELMLNVDLECIKHMKEKYFSKAIFDAHYVFTDKTFEKIMFTFTEKIDTGHSHKCNEIFSNRKTLYVDSKNTCTMEGFSRILRDRVGDDVDISSSLSEARESIFKPNGAGNNFLELTKFLKYEGNDKLLQSVDFENWYNTCSNLAFTDIDSFEIENEKYFHKDWTKPGSTAIIICSFGCFNGESFNHDLFAHLIELYPRCLQSMYNLLQKMAETYHYNYNEDTREFTKDLDKNDFETEFGNWALSFWNALQHRVELNGLAESKSLMIFIGLLLAKPLPTEFESEPGSDVLFDIIGRFSKMFKSFVENGDIPRDLLPSFLCIFETIYNHFRLVVFTSPEYLDDHNFTKFNCGDFNDRFIGNVVKVVLSHKNITSIELGCSIARVCIIHVLNDYNNVTAIVESKILVELLKCIGINQKDKLVNKLQTTFTILCRLCMEDPEFVKSVMLEDGLDYTDNIHKYGNSKKYLVNRDLQTLAQLLYEEGFDFKQMAFHEQHEELKLHISRRNKCFSKSVKPLIKTDIVGLLFSQLIASFKTDWITENDKNGNSSFSVKQSKNPAFNYMKFLLSSLTEVVVSYQQAKSDLIHYSKRTVIGQTPEPKSTSVNFLIHHILPFAKYSVGARQSIAEEKKYFLFNKARVLLQHLLIKKQTGNTFKIKPLVFDKQDFAEYSVRNHVIQCLANAIYPGSAKGKHQTLNYNEKEKIFGCLIFLRDMFLSFSNLQSEIRKVVLLIIKFNIPNLLALLLNRLDNSLVSDVSELSMQIFVCLKTIHNIIDKEPSLYNDCKPLFNLVGENLDVNTISKVSQDTKTSKKLDDDASSSDSSDDEDKGESNKEVSDAENNEENMFRHSALAMYDIEDIEEEVMNNQNSIFDEDYDEEDLAFVDNVALQDSLEILGDPVDEEMEYSDYSEDEDDSDDVDIIHGDFSMDDGQVDGDESEMDSDDEEGVIYLDNDIVLLEEDEDDEDFVENPLDYEVGDEEFNAHLNQRDLYESDFVSGMHASSSDESNLSDDASDDSRYFDDYLSVADSDEMSNDSSSDNDSRSSDDHVAQFIINDHNANLIDSSMRPRQHRNSFMMDSSNVPRLNSIVSTAMNVLPRNSRHSSLAQTFGSFFGTPNVHLLGSAHEFDYAANDPSRLASNDNDNILFSNETHQRFNPDEVESNDAPVVNKPLFLSNANLDDLFEDEVVSTTRRWIEINGMFPILPEWKLNIQQNFYAMIVKATELIPDDIIFALEYNEKLARKDPSVLGKRRAELDLESDLEMMADPSLFKLDGHVFDVTAYGLNKEEFKELQGDDAKKSKLCTQIAYCLINQELYFNSNCPSGLYKFGNHVKTPWVDYGVLLEIPMTMLEEVEGRQEAIEYELSRNMACYFEKGVSLNAEPEMKKVALYDRYAIYSLSKSFFIYQPYLKREPFHEFFTVLCKHSKTARIQLLNLILLIISEGLYNTAALNKVYSYISNKIDKIINPNSFVIKTYVLSSDCTVDNVASQTIDCLQHLTKECFPCSKFFTNVQQDLLVAKHRKFFTDRSNELSLKISDSFTIDLSNDDFAMDDSKDHNVKSCPINYLFTALCIPVVRNEVTLMDALSLSIKTIIYNNCVPKKNDKPRAIEKMKKNDKLGPLLMNGTFKILFCVVAFESSTTRTLENIINSLQALKENYYKSQEQSIEIMNMISKLSSNCLSACSVKLDEMIKLIDKEDCEILTSEDPNDIVTSMSSSNSAQSCLLKYVTIMDFLFFNKTEDAEKSISNENLVKTYTSIPFGKLWARFSVYLKKFEAKNGNTLNVTKILFLLPLLESVMIDSKIGLLMSERNITVSKVGKEFIFDHKVLLNSMIRTSPKLMNGPFSILLTLDSSAVDFDNKRFYFKTKLSEKKRANNHEVAFTVNRSSIFKGSFEALYSNQDSKFRTGKLDVTFEGEDGVDAGGLTREWYQLVTREMVSPELSLFTPVSEDNKDAFIPNRNSSVNPMHFAYFEFCGMIMAKAIHDSCFIDCHFIRPIYKAIIGKHPTLKDMESIDAEYYKSLVWILENDITDVLEMTFSIEVEEEGKIKSHDLIENGSEKAVTEENKKEYVEKVIDFKLRRSFFAQLQCLIIGFSSVIDKSLIEIFNENEVELLLNGLPDIDVDDWKNNTEYVNYTSQSHEISLFWRCVRSFNQVEKAKLLQFITGTSKVPLNGFRDLQGSNGSSKFSIHKDFGSSSRLPQAHTCFNQLDLPSYKTYDEMKRALLVAINEGSEGFGLK